MTPVDVVAYNTPSTAIAVSSPPTPANVQAEVRFATFDVLICLSLE